MDRPVDRTLRLERFVSTLRCYDFVCLNTLQRKHHVNPPNDEHPLFDLHFTVRHGDQPISTRRNPARLQRATKGAEQSPAGGGDDVIQSGGVRVRHLALKAVMTGDGAVCAKAHGLRFHRQPRQAKRALDPSDRNFGAIDDVAHHVTF